MSISAYKKTKAVLAVVAVAILSVIFACASITGLRAFQYLCIYLAGALFGLTASITTIILLKKRGNAAKLHVLVLTIAILTVGISLFALPTFRSFLLGAAEPPFSYICINFGLGYFAVGLIFDAHRVFGKRSR